MTGVVGEAGVLPVTRVALELTESCNLRCRFCYHSCAPRHNTHIAAILRRLEEARVMELVLTGGEPALAPRFFATLDSACARFFRVMVQSNGTRFADPATFAQLARRRIFCCNFSLHGPRPVHEAVTGVPGSFDATCAALRQAADARMRVASNLVLHKGNAVPEIIEESVAVLASLGCREMTVTRFVPAGQGAGQPLGVAPQNLIACLRAARLACERHGLSLLLANAIPACELPPDLRSLCNRCSYGYDKFYIDVDGNVLTCGMHRKVLGNIVTNSLDTILSHAELYKKYRALQHIPEKCSTCKDMEACGGGCRAAAFCKTHCLDGEDHI